MATLPAINYGVVAGSGVTLALPHSTGLQSSLPLLQKNYKFSKVFFWGKLMGMTGDYLIAMGIEESYGKAKFFYWCVALTSCALGRSRRGRSLDGTEQAPDRLSRRTRPSSG